MKQYDFPPYRPPNEADSCLIRFTRGCPWNKCQFCMMYKRVKFEIRGVDEILEDIQNAPSIFGRDIKSVFIGDSDSLLMKTDTLVTLLKKIREVFPNLDRVTSYARIKTLKAKGQDNLKKLFDAGLTRVHIGLESGSDKVLELINKGSKAKHFIQTAPMIHKSGLQFSLYVLLAVGGKEYSHIHSSETAEVINQSNPDFVRFRTIIPIPGSGIDKMFTSGELTYLSDKDIIAEQLNIIRNIQAKTYIANDHISNLVSIEGEIPQKKDYFLNILQKAYDSFGDKSRDKEKLLRYL